MFFVFYILGAIHHAEMATYAIIAACVYGLDRIIRFMWGFPSKTVEWKYKEGDMIQVKFKKHPLAKLFGLHKVGQYMFLNFPGVSLVEWHPFSVSSGPDERYCEVHIKALGDHTRKLVERAKTGGNSIWIRTDGPYGGHPFNYSRFPVLVLVCGGVGVTPVISMIKDIYRYGDINASSKKKATWVEKVYMLWTVQKKEQYVWFRDELRECYDKSTADPDAPILDLRIYMSRDEGGLGQFFFDGKPEIDELFDEIVKMYQGKASMVFTCGPKTMVNECWDAVNKRKASGHGFHLHYETFEF